MFVSFTKSTLLFLLALSASSATFANPTIQLNHQAPAWPGGTVTCGGSRRYSVAGVQNAANEGYRLFKSNTQVGTNKYPHRFGNRERLALSCAGPFQEFPILPGGSLYNGKTQPGADRVVFEDDKSGNSATYCGVMTHTGAPTSSGFVLCNGS